MVAFRPDSTEPTEQRLVHTGDFGDCMSPVWRISDECRMYAVLSVFLVVFGPFLALDSIHAERAICYRQSVCPSSFCDVV